MEGGRGCPPWQIGGAQFIGCNQSVLLWENIQNSHPVLRKFDSIYFGFDSWKFNKNLHKNKTGLSRDDILFNLKQKKNMNNN